MAFVNNSGEWVGFEIELAEYERSNSELRYERQAVASRTRIPLLVNGNVNMFFAVMNPTKERSEVVDFSMPYFMSGIQVLTKKDSGIKGAEDLSPERSSERRRAGLRP